jgi:glycosyltransferase involved in cell wall biosynthesis
MIPLSVVMPAWREQDIIEGSVREWWDEVVSKVDGAELIVVDDCSPDRTAEIVESLRGAMPGLRCLRLPQNLGHGGAVRAGLDAACGEWIFQTDSDRQHPAREFWQLWRQRENLDFVMGRRRSREDGPIRFVISHTMQFINWALFGVWIQDANCPFKLMRSEPLRNVLERVPSGTFIPMVMVSILASKLRYRVANQTVTHLPRTGGTQSLSGIGKWVKIGVRCTRELLALRESVR